MDFIAIDLDKYDVWDAFRQPVPIKEQMYLKTANWDPGSPPSDGCTGGIDDTECTTTGQKPKQQGMGQATPSFGGSEPDGGYQEPGSNSGDGFGQGGLTQEQMDCGTEQQSETDIDTLSAEAAADIAALDNSIEHATLTVNDNGTLRNLDIVSGDENSIPLGELYAQLDALGLDDTDIVAFTHSHPATTGVSGQAEVDDTFANGFPSANDYIAYEEFAQNAIAFGADESSWRENFSAFIIDPDGTRREFEDYSLPADQEFLQDGGIIPEIGTPERTSLEESLDEAQDDAEGTC